MAETHTNDYQLPFFPTYNCPMEHMYKAASHCILLNTHFVIPHLALDTYYLSLNKTFTWVHYQVSNCYLIMYIPAKLLKN